jgi:hypothetical protein
MRHFSMHRSCLDRGEGMHAMIEHVAKKESVSCVQVRRQRSGYAVDKLLFETRESMHT